MANLKKFFTAAKALLPGNKSKQFGYDYVEQTGLRKTRRVSYKSEDSENLPFQRRQMLAGSRDLIRNYSAAAYSLSVHTSFVCNLRFHPRTGDTGLDKALKELMTWWGRPQNCDVAARHSLFDIIHMAESMSVVDGDIFLLKLAKDGSGGVGKIQPIESDRVASMGVTNIGGVDISQFIHGVQVDAGGKALNYSVCKRGYDSLSFEKLIPASWMLQHGYFMRFDQVRGCTPLSSGLNSYQDTAEAAQYALLKMKVAQMLGLTFYRQSAADGIGEPSGDDTDSQNPNGLPYGINLQDGRPFAVELDDGDRAEWLESKNPSTEFNNYWEQMLGLAMKTLRQPSCLYFEGANYAAALSENLNDVS